MKATETGADGRDRREERGPGQDVSDARSDALVFFGATGDLAYKKIFPALQAMAKRGHLDVPVIGVAISSHRSPRPAPRMAVADLLL